MIVDNQPMSSPTDWHPVAAAHSLGGGENIVATRVLGQDLAVWRSATGLAQAWLDRCPHRGVRLSLGRVVGDRLACAYHGWEFAAESGLCVAIPALADLAEVPGRVQAGVCGVTEARQMVWVRLQSGASAPAGDAPVALPTDASTDTFLCTIALRAGISAVHGVLQRKGFEPEGLAAWRGALGDRRLRLFTQCAQADMVLLHAWACEPRTNAPHAPVFAALRRLRSDADAAAS